MADIKRVRIGNTEYTLCDEVARQITASGMVIKGVAAQASDITGLTNYVAGWCYKASAAFTIPGVGTVENGDMIISIGSNTAFTAADWTVLQNNVDTFVGTDGTTAGTRGLVPAPGTTDISKFLKGDGTWSSMSIYDDVIIIENYVIVSQQETIVGRSITLGNCFTMAANNYVLISGNGDGDIVGHILTI